MQFNLNIHTYYIIDFNLQEMILHKDDRIIIIVYIATIDFLIILFYAL